VPVDCSYCSVVRFQVDASGALAGYQNDVERAVTAVSTATGLRLRVVPAGADISLTWDPSLYDPTPGTLGEAGDTTIRTISDPSGTRLVSASIRSSEHLVGGTSPQSGEEPVQLHEFGHAVGLVHYSGPEVMNPLDQGYVNHEPGDVSGLADLYHPTCCR
jgi:hypothetical protein